MAGPCPHGLAAARVSARRWETRVDLHAWLVEARRYLVDHATEKGVVESAARHVGMSRSHFSRLFRAAEGASPRAMVLSARVALGSAALRGGRSPIEAALISGYGDVDAFTRAFKRITGTSPGKFAQSVGEAAVNDR